MGNLRKFSPTAILSVFCTFFAASFRSRAALQIEILALRHQLNVLQRSVNDHASVPPTAGSGSGCLTIGPLGADPEDPQFEDVVDAIDSRDFRRIPHPFAQYCRNAERR